MQSLKVEGAAFHRVIRLESHKSFVFNGSVNSFVDIADLKALYHNSISIDPDFIDIEAPSAKALSPTSAAYTITLNGSEQSTEWLIPIHARYPAITSSSSGIAHVFLGQLCAVSSDSQDAECQGIWTQVPHGIEANREHVLFITGAVVIMGFLMVLWSLVIDGRARKDKLK